MGMRLFLFAVALLACVATSVADESVAGKPGGWSKVHVDDEGVVAAAAFALQAKQAAMRDGSDQTPLSLETIVAAEQQVVAGTNYRLTLQVQLGKTTRTAEAIVWARVWLDEPERYQLTSWQFTDAESQSDASP